MKKIKSILSLAVMVGLFAMVSGSVSAVEINTNASINASTNVNTSKGVGASVAVNATSSATTSKGSSNRSATSTDPGKSDNADSHRSVVAAFVQGLLNVADREGGIGAEVRVIAQEQNDSASTTVEAMAELEERGGLKTFLIGTDYKSAGVIRSELAKTDNQIERLKKLVSRATSEADKAELNVQIESLVESQVEIENFVELHESKFSLLGWFVKLFNN